MLRTRVCAGLALSVAALLGAASSAHAATYCLDPAGSGVRGCTPAASPQHALDMAKANPGFDVVVLGARTYEVDSLQYSDAGATENGILIEGRTHCPDRYTCNSSALQGGAPGAAVLSLAAAAGSDVRIQGVRLQVTGGAVGLSLGPGARAGVSVYAENAVAVRLDGTASLPAVISGGSYFGKVAVDAPGYGIVENADLLAFTGVRGHPGGFVDIRGGGISAFNGVVAPAARITGTAMTFDDTEYFAASGSPVGVETSCTDAGSPDAAIEIVNATINARNAAGATGVLASARGGDGASCDAAVDISSTIVNNTEVSLDAHGETGSGADPRDGTARIDVSYSDFRATATRVTAPATIETATPGHNVDVDPQFAAPGWLAYPLLSTSPLIDAGDPAVPAEWQRPYVGVARGRRDIGEFEYGFTPPELRPFAFPNPVAVGTLVDIYSGAGDPDIGDQVTVMWTLRGITVSSETHFAHEFAQPGRYVLHASATDSTGQVVEGQLTVRVLRQRLNFLRVRPMRFRPAFKRSLSGATIRFYARAADTVVFRVHRATRRHGSRRIRWKRVPGSFDYPVYAGDNSVPFDGWMKRKLRPGLYRLTAKGRGDGAAAQARFRIIR